MQYAYNEFDIAKKEQSIKKSSPLTSFATGSVKMIFTGHDIMHKTIPKRIKTFRMFPSHVGSCFARFQNQHISP